MKIAYHADDAIDAQLIADLLNDNDIFAQVRGAHMQGAVGEAAAMGNVKVWVHDEDFERGRELVEDWESAQIIDDSTSEYRQIDISASGNKTLRFVKNISLFISGIIFALALQKYWGQGSSFGSSISYTDTGLIEKLDANYDGLDDQIYYVGDTGLASEVHLDTNFDGEIDGIIKYDRRGLTDSAKADYDFDGVFETNEEYRYGVISKIESDFDQDGYYEVTSLYKADEGEERYLSKSSFGSPKKYQKFEKGRLVYAKLDQDGDGKYDVEYYYDDVEEVKSKNKL
ncbi:putative signal transducing protein [Kangiella shandongensis]|uniref:putative signal transducing protein n=1 Tax=Kangiella shandongensis TaxID=2763258 RepID=UPI001CC1A9C3|nr:DUF2007 domain-containing protein [Kangiella shandongensis]